MLYVHCICIMKETIVMKILIFVMQLDIVVRGVAGAKMKSRHEIGEGSGFCLRPPVGPGQSRGRGSSDFSDLECFKSDSKIVLLLKIRGCCPSNLYSLSPSSLVMSYSLICISLNTNCGWPINNAINTG